MNGVEVVELTKGIGEIVGAVLELDQTVRLDMYVNGVFGQVDELEVIERVEQKTEARVA